MTGTPKTEDRPAVDAGVGHEQMLTDLQAEMEALVSILPGAGVVAAAVAAMGPVPPADDEQV